MFARRPHRRSRPAASLSFAAAVATILLVAASCATVPDGELDADVGTTGVGAGGAAAGTDTTRVRAVVPPGYGTLRQDAITVALQHGELLVKLTPLDEATIRLLAPDTYARLHALRESRRPEATRNALAEVELFLVSFFSYRPDVSFQPEDVQIVYQARLRRPVSIVPLTSGWGRQRLGQQETQSAVYAFDGPFDFDQVFTVRYGLTESTDWQQIVPVLETERAKIATRTRDVGR